MRVIITAGGTGGHIIPALAIIDKIKKEEPDSEFLYIGTNNRMEKDMIPKLNLRYEPLKIYGLKRKFTIDNLKNVDLLFKAIKRAKEVIKEFNPDIVVGVGGYITVPVIYAANKLGYKTIIHEQNSVPGLANKFISKKADMIALSFRESEKYFSSNKIVFTGNPCGEQAFNSEAMDKTKLGFDESKKLVVIVMGSLGSNRINDYIKNVIPMFKGKEYEVLIITGKSYYDSFIENLEISNNVKVLPYLEDLSSLFKNTDLIISRAGASTMSEITALQIPSILIPSPYVPNDHQTKNAEYLLKKKAALVIAEADLTSKILLKNIDTILTNDKKREKMIKKLESFKVTDGSTRIYNEIKKIVM